MTDRAHGTRNKYKTEGCRCEPCRAAAAEYRKEHPAAGGYAEGQGGLPAMRARFAYTGYVPSHSRTGYQVGCRCRICRDAAAEYRAEYTARSGGGRTLNGRWYCPDCDDAHAGPCPRIPVRDRTRWRLLRRRTR